MSENWFAKQPKEHLAGKCAIVVGGNSGIGKAAAEAIAAAGANMVIAGVPEAGCHEVAEELKAQGTKAVGVACDVTSQESIDNVIKVAEENFGQIDILVTSAGIALPRMNAVDVAPEQWDKLFSINLKGNFFLMTSVARAMEAKNIKGKMVVVASARGINSMENIAPYCIAKAGVMGMVRSWLLTSPRSRSWLTASLLVMFTLRWLQRYSKSSLSRKHTLRAALLCLTTPVRSTKWALQFCTSFSLLPSTPLVRLWFSTVAGPSSNNELLASA